MEIDEVDMRRTVNLINDLSDENRRLKRQRAILRAALRNANQAIRNLGGAPPNAHVALAMRGRR